MTKNRAPFYLLLFPSERERNATVVSVITPLMHRVVKARNQRESASLDREIKEQMESVVIRMGIERRRPDNQSRLRFRDQVNESLHNTRIRLQQKFRQPLIGQLQKIRTGRRMTEHLERFARLVRTSHSPEQTMMRLDFPVPFGHAHRPGIIIAVGGENDAHTGAGRGRSLQETGGGE